MVVFMQGFFCAGDQPGIKPPTAPEIKNNRVDQQFHES